MLKRYLFAVLLTLLLTGCGADYEERSAANKAEGQAFLTENAKRPEVKVLPSGLQFEVLNSGDGPRPKLEDSVRVHYTGTLVDGREFDSSRHRAPISFPLQGVIPGWIEALQLMPVGARWKLYIPSGLAYGPRVTGNIGPHSTLIFDVELLGIEPR